MNTWRTLLPHELDDIEKKIEAGEALDVGLLRSLVTTARYNEARYQSGYDRGYVDGFKNGPDEGYDRGYENGWNEGYNSGYDDGIES